MISRVHFMVLGHLEFDAPFHKVTIRIPEIPQATDKPQTVCTVNLNVCALSECCSLQMSIENSSVRRCKLLAVSRLFETYFGALSPQMVCVCACAPDVNEENVNKLLIFG